MVDLGGMRTTRPHPRHLAALAALLVVVVPVARGTYATSNASSAAAQPRAAATEDLAGPDGMAVVARHVADDMAVEWLEAPPAGADDWVAVAQRATHGPAPDDHAAPDDAQGDHAEHDQAAHGTDVDAETQEAEQEAPASAVAAAGTSSPTAAAASPGQGFAVFATSPRWLRSGYTIRLAGSDARIEQYRDELAAAAGAATSTTGLPVRVAAGRGGSTTPTRAEIVAVVGHGPCGPSAIGCGGPSYTSTELVAGRVWIDPAGLSLSAANRQNLAAHELGHALGLQHYSASWADGRQAMHPTVSQIPAYRSGDVAGLRFMAGAYDKPAGSVVQRSYDAGHARVTGTLASGRRVRVTVGSMSRDATADGGRFSVAVPAGAGTHRVCVTSLDAAVGFRRDLGCGEVVAPGAPVGRYETATGSFETIRLVGWAIDPQTSDPVRVEVSRGDRILTTVTADGPRPDVGSSRPHYGSAHGYDVEVPAVAGVNDLCVRILGVGGGGDADLGCRRVVHTVDPIGAFALIGGEPLAATITGWALDPNTPSPVEVRVTIDGLTVPVVGQFRAQEDRHDVARQHPAHGPAHGFTQRLTLTPGDHEVCLTVFNVGLGQDRSLGCAGMHVASAGGAVPDLGRSGSPGPTGVPAVDALVGDTLGLVGSVTDTLVGG